VYSIDEYKKLPSALQMEADENDCTTFLVQNGVLPQDATNEDSNRIWADDLDSYCPSCPVFKTCPVVWRNL